jgi:DNA-directed RNA polymerase specialized sigma24 family protein
LLRGSLGKWSKTLRCNARRLEGVDIDVTEDAPTPQHGDERLAWLDRSLSKLPAPQRVVVERHFAGVPDSTIAEELGYTVHSVRTLRLNGMNQLRAMALDSPPIETETLG